MENNIERKFAYVPPCQLQCWYYVKEPLINSSIIV